MRDPPLGRSARWYEGGVAGVRIALTDPDGTPRQITKIVGMADGGFAVTVPYHSERTGFLFRMAVDYSQTSIETGVEEMVPYTADDRVKLSLHLDGFVQFSGERPGRVLSGRNSDGSAKGLGLVKNPLNEPLRTGGPMFGVSAWGVEEFDELPNKKAAIVFREADLYNRDCTIDDFSGYLIEGFVYSRRYIGRATLGGPSGLRLTRQFPNYTPLPARSSLTLPTRQPLFEERGAIFDLAVVDVGSPHVIIGLLVSRAKLEMPSNSGFALASPSDMRHVLQAMYPNPFPEPPPTTASLNYSPS